MSASYRQAVTDFIFVEDKPEESDIIFIPGSGHPDHVLAAAELYNQGFAPLLLPSGLHAKGAEAFTAVPGFASEWEWMQHLLIQKGIPEDVILREDRSTFTWENATLSRSVTDALHLRIRQALLCCRAHHARRALFYYQAAFPEARILVIPAADPGISRETWYQTEKGRHTVLGEVRRMGSQILEIYDCLEEGTTPPMLNITF